MEKELLSIHYGNSFLARSFEKEIYINHYQLQRMLYIFYMEFWHRSRRIPFLELFNVYKYGPFLSSIESHFSCFGNDYIDKYARNAKGKAKVLEESNELIRETLDDVFDRTCHISWQEMSDILRVPGSAWDKAFQREDYIIDIYDIKNDTTYRDRLGFSYSFPLATNSPDVDN